MKNAMRDITLFTSKVDVRVIIFILAVAMFVLAAGAPSATGGIGG